MEVRIDVVLVRISTITDFEERRMLARGSSLPRLTLLKDPFNSPVHRQAHCTLQLLASDRRTIVPIMSASSAHLFQRGPGNPMAIGTFPSFSTVNFYAGSRLSRLSWLRQSADFLNEALTSEKTRFILLNHLNPMVHASADNTKGAEEGALATLSWDEVKETILDSVAHDGSIDLSSKGGKVALFGPHAHQLKPDNPDDKITQGMGPPSLALVFLGMDETHLNKSSLPGDVVQKNESQQAAGEQYSPAGIPIFALSLSFRPPGSQEDIETPLEKLATRLTKDGHYEFVDTRALAHAGKWPLHDAAIVAQARSLIDWNERHQVRSNHFSLKIDG